VALFVSVTRNTQILDVILPVKFVYYSKFKRALSDTYRG